MAMRTLQWRLLLLLQWRLLQLLLLRHILWYTHALRSFDKPVWQICNEQRSAPLGADLIADAPGSHVIGESELSRILDTPFKQTAAKALRCSVDEECVRAGPCVTTSAVNAAKHVQGDLAHLQEQRRAAVA
jgi:hypothetical protein